MKKNYITTLLLIVFLVSGCASSTVTQTPPPLLVTPPSDMQSIEGKLRNQVGRLEKSMPRAGSQGYILPTDEEKVVFSEMVASLRHDDLQSALTAANANGYELIWYSDQNDDNAVSYVLREEDPSKKGWGLYILRAATNSNVIIEAPHPLFDEGTPDLSAELYRALDARALLVAGAHRDANKDGSADASDNPQSIFQAMHEAELLQSLDSVGSAIILQIHGFSGSKHPAYPHVIVSYEHGADINPVDIVTGQRLANRIVDALKKNGIKTGLCDGNTWRDLCGRTNVQATLMTRGIFIHIELDEKIRKSDKKFIDALVAALINP